MNLWSNRVINIFNTIIFIIIWYDFLMLSEHKRIVKSPGNFTRGRGLMNVEDCCTRVPLPVLLCVSAKSFEKHVCVIETIKPF